MTIVYWAARNVEHYLYPGNHHFVLVTGNNETCQQFGIMPNEYKGMKFFTLAANVGYNNNMTFNPNNALDVKSVREKLDNPADSGWFGPESNWDFQGHEINAPNGCNYTFSKRLLTLCANFEKNSQTNPIQIQRFDQNCAAWVNTLFEVAGVPYSERLRAGEFSGIDCGEEESIPRRMFK